MTIAALRALLDEIDTEGGPEAARRARPLTDPQPRERSSTPMTQPTPTAPAPVADVQPKASADVRLRPITQAHAEAMPVGHLLAWGDQHPDPGIRDQAERARTALTALRQRHAADQELTAITDETAQLEKRLAELRAREAELAPAKQRKARKPVDYPAVEVRAWAAANNIPCPDRGRVPKAVVDAWRADTTTASA